MWSTSSLSTSKSTPAAPVEITVRDLDAETRQHSPPSSSFSGSTSLHSAMKVGSSSTGDPSSSSLTKMMGNNSNPTSLSMGSLLRLFRSEFFDAFMAVTYLYRYRDSGGVHDYLCNQLYTLGDADLETFMPQVCNLLVHHSKQSPALERFVMDKCADTMHIALQVFWFLQAAVEDAARRPDQNIATRVRLLRSRCETAAVNGSKRIMLAAAAQRISAATLIATEPPFSPRTKQVSSLSLFSSNSAVNLRSEKTQEDHLQSQHKDVHVQHDSVSLPETHAPSNFLADSNLSPSSSSHNSQSQYKRFPSSETDVSSSTSASASALSATHTTSTDTSTLEDSDAHDFGAFATMSSRGVSEVYGDDDNDDDEKDGENHKNETKSNTNDHSNDIADDQLSNGNQADVVDIENVELSFQDLDVNEEREYSTAKCESKERENASVEDAVTANLPNVSDEKSEAVVSESSNAEIPDINQHRLSKKEGSKEINIDEDFDPLALLAMKQERCDYFNDSVSVAKAFVRLSLTTRDLPQDQRMAHLTKGLQEINDMLLRRMKGEPGEPLIGGAPAPDADEVAKLGRAGALRSIHLPLTRASSQALRIVRVHTDEVTILTSRTRAPYRVNIEVLPTDMLCSDKLLFCEHRVDNDKEKRGSKDDIYANDDDKESRITKEGQQSHENHKRKVGTVGLKRKGGRRLSEMTPVERQIANVRKVIYGDPYTATPEVFEEAEARSNAKEKDVDVENEDYKSRQAVILGIYGELWSWKEKRILDKSPFRDLQGTRLMPFIVKAGDDLRQEQLAIQLIGQLDKIFRDEGVHVYLKPFTVMSVSSEAGFVEVIKDAVSVHSLKKRTPNFVSLLDYYERAYGAIGTDGFRAAQRRFIRSMAGYSLVTYLLQIKDRHNGNIMIDARGQIIHIDFGFMLTNSPGAIKFENVPFKLTEEYLQVMCARQNVTDINETCRTEGYHYFQELFVLGLLAARKHYEKITTLVEIMTEGTTMPCMTTNQVSGQAIVEALQNRFAVGMPEEQCIKFALSLIEESRLNWRSAGYDRFQAYSNGYR